MSGISIAATNPCHLYDLARELHELGQLDTYYSGYPAWKLHHSQGLPLRTFPLRTLSVYGLLRFVNPALRPKDRALFQWQDENFDRAVAKALRPSSAIHGMPGQCLETFRTARRFGTRTILNHATGPVTRMASTLKDEYERVGMRFDQATRFDAAYRAREEEEYALADYHCVASSIVADQLASIGIARERIWLVPYGSNEDIFYPADQSCNEPNDRFRIVFAGQLTLRKGVRFLLEALTQANQPTWEMHVYGDASAETKHDIATYRGSSPLRFHGAVSQNTLADAFRSADLLVLPSLEEGFGLVVVQALSCGLPCVVTEATGAKDLIRHHENGSVIPAAQAEALTEELGWWSQHQRCVPERHHWRTAADRLLQYHHQHFTLVECA